MLMHSDPAALLAEAIRDAERARQREILACLILAKRPSDTARLRVRRAMVRADEAALALRRAALMGEVSR